MSSAPIVRAVPSAFEFNPEQRRMILDSFLSGASEAEATVLLELARVRRLNPITRQIHFVKRWDMDKQREVWAAQVGIDGFRSIAERTGLYDGQDEPEFGYSTVDGRRVLVSCKVKVYRKDWSRPAVGVAFLNEYAQRKKDGNFTRMWAEKPHVMLAKCAEALAFRKAFPEDTSGLYAPEEEAGESLSDTPEAPQGRRVEALKAQVAAKLGKAAPSSAVVDAPVAAPAEPEKPPPSRNGRRMPIHDVPADGPPEPPPPGDEDAPFEVAADVQDDRPYLPPPAETPVAMSFGSGKGRPLAELQKKDLVWYAKVLAENVADPSKSRYRTDNETKLRAIQAELHRRQA